MTRDWKELRYRLAIIAEIIESVDNRCMAADGPVTPTLQEMRQEEISAIYAIATGETLNVDQLRRRIRKPVIGKSCANPEGS